MRTGGASHRLANEIALGYRGVNDLTAGRFDEHIRHNPEAANSRHDIQLAFPRSMIRPLLVAQNFLHNGREFSS